MKKALMWPVLLLVFTLLLVSAQSVFAGGPVGHADTLEADLRYGLQKQLDQGGYMGQFNNGQDLQRGVSAYLWDNRQWFKSLDFHNSLKMDAVVCLMHKQGYPGFDTYMQNEMIKSWCEQIVAQP